MVRKLTFMTLVVLNFIFLLFSCNYKSKNGVKRSEDINYIKEQISQVYKKEMLNEDILMIVIKDSVVLSPISFKSAPHRTTISLCFTDDLRYFIDYDSYKSFAVLIQELKVRITHDIQEVDRKTISITISDHSRQRILPSLVKEISTIQMDTIMGFEGVYLFVYLKERVTNCIPPVPPK